MRKRQIKKINLSSIFMILVFILTMGIAYSIYTERYYGGNNFITMGNVYLRGYGDNDVVITNLFPESIVEVKNPAIHPYREVAAGRDTLYLRDNEMGFILEGKNDSKEDIKFRIALSNGDNVEGLERAPFSLFGYIITIEDFESGSSIFETSSNFYSSISLNLISDNFVLKGNGGSLKWVVKACFYYYNTSTVYPEGSSSGTTVADLDNYFFSAKLSIENDGNSTLADVPSINNMGLYKMTGKSYIDDIVVEQVDEQELIQSVIGLNKLDYDDNIDLSNMDGSYIDLSYSLNYKLTGDYSRASNCSILSESFCSNKGFYPGTYVTLSKMFSTYGLYLNRQELDELENNGIIERLSASPNYFAYGFVEDNTLTIKYSDNKLHLPKDSQYFFADFGNVESIDFTNIDTKNCISLAYMFKNDTSINNVDLRKTIKKNWRSLFGLFYNCQSLVNYSFNYYSTGLNSFYTGTSTSSDYRLYYIRDMGYMFYHCTSLTTDPNNHYFFLDDYSSYGYYVENLQHMFEGCTSLVTVAYYNSSYGLLGYTGSNVFDMSYMYKDCTNLVSFCDTSLYTTDNIGISNVTNMEGMFYNCTSLEALPLVLYSSYSSLKNPVTGSTAYCASLDYAFYNCTSATRIVTYSSASAYTYVTSISHAFENCTSLVSYTVQSSNNGFSNLVDASFAFKNCTSLTTINMKFVFGESGNGTGANLESMFEGCTSIDVITSSASSGCIYNLILKSPSSMKNMFKGCTALESVTMDNYVFNMEPDKFNSAFSNCGHITLFKITNSTFGKNFGNGIDSNGTSIFTMSGVFANNVSILFINNSMLYFTSIAQFKGTRTYYNWSGNITS